ncbi:PAS domain-containing sensor histidine kinase, partial [candidate division KSB1 bacterium]|nr:PAS domain-containing sensor histidine kinase [candidate division KSB1 bacterium]
KIKLEDQLRHADRLATIGQLAAGVAHELNEPLGNILGFAQLIQKNPELSEQTNRDTEKIVAASLYAREVIRKLMLFARQTPPSKSSVNLNKIIQDGLYFLEARCQKSGIELIRKLDGKLPEIIADSSQLHQVLVNLIVNAIQAMPDGGQLIVGTSHSENAVILEVQDKGTGMDHKTLKQIFVPFFTTKDVDQGTGLGLAVVHGIVTAHGGRIDVESNPGKGSIFRVILPVPQSLEKKE